MFVVIDIKKCNFQNISAFFSNTSKKYYLTHFDCYLKSNSNPISPKILSLLNIADAKINSQISSLTNIETSNFIRNDKKAYFVSIEGYHPISSFLLFKIERICNGLEHSSHVIFRFSCAKISLEKSITLCKSQFQVDLNFRPKFICNSL